MPIEPTAEQVATVTAELAPVQAALDAATVPHPTAILTRSSVSQGEIQRARADWQAVGRDVGAFDAAATADGLKITSAAGEDNDGRAPSAQASAEDYHPVFDAVARSLPPERLIAVQKETTAWAAEMHLPAELGTQIIEHIAQIGPRFTNSSAAQKAEWLQNERAIALRRLGSDGAVDALKEKATKALSIAANNPFGRTLQSSPVLNSFWLMSALANHGDRSKLM